MRLEEKKRVNVRFLLGPAGVGKTHRCLTEIASELEQDPAGPPLILLVPKQATFQLERRLLLESGLPGYTRLRILSFERLAEFLLEALEQPCPNLLDEEGRVMVLHALLSRERSRLELFHATARFPGFSRQLSDLLRELQRSLQSPSRLTTIAGRLETDSVLAKKLRDLALLLQAYRDWLRVNGLEDADGLLDAATDALRNWPLHRDAAMRHATGEQAQLFETSAESPSDAVPRVGIARLWLDGFAEMTDQELSLLVAVAPFCGDMTLAFCLEEAPKAPPHWLSTWSVVGRTFHECHQRLAMDRENSVSIEVLERDRDRGRFAQSPVLFHLESHWNRPEPWGDAWDSGDEPPSGALLVMECKDAEAEAVEAARAIRRFVREGRGQYRDVAVLVRRLEDYHDVLRRVLTRYGIPFFLDRRESVAHHPMAELTRCALRTVAFNWRHEDWFGVLKTGLVPADAGEVDRLENEALARGWEGRFWREGGAANHGTEESMHRLRQRLIAPFLEFETRIQGGLRRSSKAPEGRVLAQAIGDLWWSLRVEERLADWSGRALEDGAPELAAVHGGVWNQMQQWLNNLATAFAAERFDLSEWLAVMESGLSGLTVGVIPPSLDQVLIGAVDRSRNPDLKLALVLGMNEGRFPSPPPLNLMLTDPERERLALDHRLSLGPDSRQRLGHERYYGYIACTRARHRLILTFARSDDKGCPQNPSVFLTHLRGLFPGLSVQDGGRIPDWADCEHSCELPAVLARRLGEVAGTDPGVPDAVQSIPEIASLMKRLRDAGTPAPDNLSPGLAERLYGPALRTSVSRLEQFAACPFKFFVHSGMRAEERELFEADARAQGSFQHEVLARFHASVRDQGREWRDLTPREARERVTVIGRELSGSFGGGVLAARPESEYLAERLTETLADFIELQVQWMGQYRFNPREAELTFGIDEIGLPGWRLELGEGHELLFRGKIDRVDLWIDPDAREALCVVVDYKSGVLKLDEELMAAGVQLQLPAYLGVLRQLPEAATRFGVQRLRPAGVFYVSLRGQAASHRNRQDALDRPEEIRAEAFRHSGRFDVSALDRLDASGAAKGAQFNYRRKQDGTVARTSADPMETAAFAELLDRVERRLIEMGREIFAGVARVDPYQKGRKRPCDHCRYQAICRIDPWTHEYRGLGRD